jgi:hypothetical protein
LYKCIYGLIQVMASNGISTLTYKRARQLAKLDLAADNRDACGSFI